MENDKNGVGLDESDNFMVDNFFVRNNLRSEKYSSSLTI